MFTNENQGINSYLVYTLDPQDVLDKVTLGMLTNNEITGLTPVLFSQMNEQKICHFNITARQTLKDFLSRPVRKQQILTILQNMLNTILNLDAYLIPKNQLLLDAQFIYVEIHTMGVQLICLPIEQTEESVDLKNFFRNLIFNLNYDESENDNYMVKLMNFFNGAQGLDIQACLALIFSLMKNETAAYTQRQSAAQPVKPREEAAPMPQRETQAAQPEIKPKQPQPVPAQTIPQPPIPPRPPVSPQPAISPQPQDRKNGSVRNESVKRENTKNASRPAGFEIPGLHGNEKEKKKGFSLFNNGKRKENAGQNVNPVVIPGQQAQNRTGNPAPGPAGQYRQIPPAQYNQALPSGYKQAPPSGYNQAPPSAYHQLPPSGYHQASSQYQPSPANEEKIISVAQSENNKGTTYNFGDTTILNAGGGGVGETTVLSNQMAKVQPYLIRKKNNVRIPITKENFRIGRERNYVDYFIEDNSHIGRNHAEIITRNEKYYIVDKNSRNHTYVDGEQITSEIEVPIGNGTVIRLADEEFEFKFI